VVDIYEQQLGLGRLNVSIWWQRKRGMVVSQIKGSIKLMKKYEDPHNSLYYMLQVMTWVEKKVGFACATKK
jgi:hypothetical protein